MVIYRFYTKRGKLTYRGNTPEEALTKAFNNWLTPFREVISFSRMEMVEKGKFKFVDNVKVKDFVLTNPTFLVNYIYGK